MCTVASRRLEANDKTLCLEPLLSSSENVDGLLLIAFPFSPSSMVLSPTSSLSVLMSLYDGFELESRCGQT
jgi:hypothetical protein